VAEPLHVELVAADREVWSGEATIVVARTLDGDVGILPGHAPLLGLLADGVVEIRTPASEEWVAAVHGGFLSVAQNRVSILAEVAEMAHEIDLEKARRDVEQARAAGANDEEAQAQLRAAETRIRAVELAR
jgi:F-type H+-transporting ATPase subunit epsilon